MENHENKRDRILACEEADRWASTSNLVATTLLLAMGGLWDGAQRLITAAEAFRNSATDAEVAQLFPLFVEVGKLDENLQQGLQEGLERGLKRNAQETARRMLAKDFSWADITDITGLAPEDLAD